MNVLIVDDQLGIRRLLAEVLQEDGYQIDMAANGYDAIAVAKKVPPDVVLMDMKMPGMDGLETLRELKKMYVHTKYIMMTAYGELELVNEAMKLGAYKYITKPFDINVIKEVVRNASQLVHQESGFDTKIG